MVREHLLTHGEHQRPCYSCANAAITVLNPASEVVKHIEEARKHKKEKPGAFITAEDARHGVPLLHVKLACKKNVCDKNNCIWGFVYDECPSHEMWKP